MTAAAIRRLTLTNFRSYHAASLDIGGNLVVLTGPNGAGKTNLIEAISFLVPGRGLRRATLEEVAFSEGDGSWAVVGRGRGHAGPRHARHRHRAAGRRGRGAHPPMPHRPRAGRLGRGLRRSSARGLADAGDGSAVRRAGLGAPALPRPPGARGRRRALRAASTRWSARCARATACWRIRGPIRTGSTPSSTRPPSLRSRSRRSAPRPCTACRARWPRRKDDAFPVRRDRARRLDGAAAAGPSRGRDRGALSRASSRTTAPRDAAAGRTLDGPHLTDLAVIYSPKNIPAADASTGEQKALLIGLVLAHAGLLAEMTGFAPVLLLDEVVAHLDPDAPRGALRRARRARRAGLHDRRRSGRLRRCRRRAGRCVRGEPGAGRSASR